jgi:hypothetical protein
MDLLCYIFYTLNFVKKKLKIQSPKKGRKKEIKKM